MWDDVFSWQSRQTKQRIKKMSHELTKDDNMMYVGEKPWHGIGVELPDVATAAEAIEAAQLGWNIVQSPVLYLNAMGEYKQIKKNLVNIRENTGNPLGIVTESYKIVQNPDAFDFMDALTGTDEAKYETAGSLFGGRKVWMMARLVNTMFICDDDKINQYICLMNSHDGTSAVKVFLTAVRVVCNNTLTLALRDSDAKVSIVHSGDIEAKMEEARRVLSLALDGFSDAEKNFKLMAAKKITDEQADGYFMDLFDKGTKRFDNIRKQVSQIYHEGPNAERGLGTMWGAFNSVTDFVDHYRGGKQITDRNFNSRVFGGANLIKLKAYNHATAISA